MENRQKSSSSGILKSIGPGLLFASAAIGTSHLVLSTRAGAYHGMVVFWIILFTQFFKYPFFEFGPRYTLVTGLSILQGYKKQGGWAIMLFMIIIFINMFAVTGALAAVTGGILKSLTGTSMEMPYLVATILVFTAGLLILGGYRMLDDFIKLLSVILLITICIAFVAVLMKGKITPIEGFQPESMLTGPGLALLISLLGWMPSGMEASAMNSIWVVEKTKATGYAPNIKEGLFDFNIGYLFATITALMFMIIGSYSLYGSGVVLDSNSGKFSAQLLQIFSSHLGPWSTPIIGIAALGCIYGTLITAWDAFARSWVRGLRIFSFSDIHNESEHFAFLKKYYTIFLPIIGIGGFLLFSLFSSSMIALLEAATITAFITAPVIAFLNLRVIRAPEIPVEFQPPQWMILTAYAGLSLMVIFSVYYIYSFFN